MHPRAMAGAGEGRQPARVCAGAVQAASVVFLRRVAAARPAPAAAAPNSRTIGGAGTGVGLPLLDPLLPVELHPPFDDQPPLELLLDEVDDEVEDEDEEEVDDEVEVETLPLDDVEVDTLPLEEVEVDTLPLDEVEVDTLPLDEVEVDTFPLDEDVLLTLPLEVDVEEVLLTPPVEVELDDPPDEVEVEEPPVEEEVDEPPDPPDEVELEVEPPLVLEVEEITIPVDPPPLPPKNPPAKKPPPNPPQPPLPPNTTGGAAGALVSIIGAAGSAIGGACVATVTTEGGQAGAGRTRATGRTRSTGRRTGLCATFFLLNSVRGLAFSATCTAPPPINAPPAVHAASFTKAIRTDMVLLSYLPGEERSPQPLRTMCAPASAESAKQRFKFKRGNHD
ncbi:MAG: hypothetical protein P0Y64_09625 [Candidatus Sphingomonas colombiensis]|nr:hypothetical protein [Sphingomonas sp.]WEK41687.1 MAG: hypothetical protein P0Y64_09625 [Sphingomonas sp.]